MLVGNISWAFWMHQFELGDASNPYSRGWVRASHLATRITTVSPTNIEKLAVKAFITNRIAQSYRDDKQSFQRAFNA